MHVLLLVLIFEMCNCDWVSDWLAPVQYQYKGFSSPNFNDTKKFYQEDDPVNDRIPQYLTQEKFGTFEYATYKPNIDNTPLGLQARIEEILNNAEILLSVLKREIAIVEERERVLKEAIANGRSGVTTLTVSKVGRTPRTYIIRDGTWTHCNGLIQSPLSTKPYNTFTELFSTPRCIGQEVISKRDPCVFNSIIKYETVPTTRRSFYIEDDYFCLKPSFNNTLETYMTVPKRIVNETCKNGTIKSLANNIFDCGVRVLSEYTYYPYRDEKVSNLPLEYCSEQDGSCRLMVGWHLSNRTVENFEFLENDKQFKKFFIRPEDDVEPFI